MKVFDLEPREYEFQLKGEDYVLVEASAEDGRLYRNAEASQFIRTAEGSLVTSEDPTGASTILVQRCCRVVKTDRSGEKRRVPVSLTLVRSWPDRITRELFDEAKYISGMDDGRQTLDSLKRKRDRIDSEIKGLEKGGEVDESPLDDAQERTTDS